MSTNLTKLLISLLFLPCGLYSELLSISIIDFESSLQLQDHVLLDQHESMVYLPDDFIATIKNISLDNKEFKGLVEHINAGYSVAPLQEVSVAIEQVIKEIDAKTASYAVIKDYQQALLSGDALIRTAEIPLRSGRNGKFCTLFVQKCATIGNLDVKYSTHVGGNLIVDGNIAASSFSFTGTTDCAGTINLPNVVSCGSVLIGDNVAFNTKASTLNVQGSVEAKSKLIRGTVALVPTGTVSLASTNVSSPITVNGSLPNAQAAVGSGFTVATVVGAGYSSGIQNGTGGGNNQFYFVVGLQIPVTFANSYSGKPTVSLTLESANTLVDGGLLVGANSAATLSLNATNIQQGGMIMNLVFSITAQGATYANALTIAQQLINQLLGKLLSIDFIAEGAIA